MKTVQVSTLAVGLLAVLTAHASAATVFDTQTQSFSLNASSSAGLDIEASDNASWSREIVNVALFDDIPDKSFSSSISLPKFDSALGTLNSAFLSWSEATVVSQTFVDTECNDGGFLSKDCARIRLRASSNGLSTGLTIASKYTFGNTGQFPTSIQSGGAKSDWDVNFNPSEVSYSELGDISLSSSTAAFAQFSTQLALEELTGSDTFSVLARTSFRTESGEINCDASFGASKDVCKTTLETTVNHKFDFTLTYNYSYFVPDPEPEPSVVPLPAAGGLLILAIGGLAALRRRRN